MHAHAALIKTECTETFPPCGHVGFCAFISLQKPNLGISREMGREASRGLAGGLGIWSVHPQPPGRITIYLPVRMHMPAVVLVPMATQVSNSMLSGQLSAHWAVDSIGSTRTPAH